MLKECMEIFSKLNGPGKYFSLGVKNMFARPVSNTTQVGVFLASEGLAVANIEIIGQDDFILKSYEYIDEKDPEEQFKALNLYIKKNRLKRKSCIVVIEEGKYNLIQMPAPYVEEKEMKSALRWSLHDYIDYPVENSVIEIFKVPGDEHHQKKVYVVVSKEQEIRDIAKFIDKAGLNLKVIDIPQLALRNVLKNNGNYVQGIALLTFKKEYGSINIYKNSELYLSRKIDTGLTKISSMLSQGKSELEINELLYDPIILELQRSLDFYESSFYTTPIKQILVAPGCEMLHGFCEYTNKNSGVSVELIDLRKVFSKAITFKEESDANCFLAIAAALKNLELQNETRY